MKEHTESEHAFKALGLNEELCRAIEQMGWAEPTPIQAAAIPAVLTQDEDILALAQTGTGKTGAFSLPLLQTIDLDKRDVQVLIIAPTRELALQIMKDVDSFTAYMPEFRGVALYGGNSMRDQLRSLKNGAQLVVGTPGRIADMLRRGKLELSSLQTFVLDEADEMLSMGFKDELDEIRDALPEQHRVLLFSATMLDSLVKSYLRSYITIEVAKRNQTARGVEFRSHVVHARDKYEALKRLCDMHPNIYGIIFCRTRENTKQVATKLMHDGYNADALHGDLSQDQRAYVMERFRAGHIQMLVATDVAARGLDVDDLTHVIHYALPDDPEVFLHRSGRTARAGKDGISVAIINMKERGKLKFIEKTLKIEVPAKPLPTAEEICAVQLYALIERIHQTDVQDDLIDPYIPMIEATLEDLSREELIRRVLYVEFQRFLDYYQGRKDLIDPQKGRGRDVRRDRDGSRDGYRAERKGKGDPDRNLVTITVELGKDHGARPKDILDLINHTMRNRRIDVGSIILGGQTSEVEVEAEYAKDIVDALAQGGGNLEARRDNWRADHQRDDRRDGGYRGGNRRGGDRRGGDRRDDRRGGDRRGGSGYRGRDDRRSNNRGRDDRRDGGYRGRDDRRSGASRRDDRRDDRRSGGYRGRDDKRSGGGYRGRDDRRGPSKRR